MEGEREREREETRESIEALTKSQTMSPGTKLNGTLEYNECVSVMSEGGIWETSHDDIYETRGPDADEVSCMLITQPNEDDTCHSHYRTCLKRIIY